MSNLKLLAGDFSDTHVVKMYRDTEGQEFVVRLFEKRGGKLIEQDKARYYTDDRADALATLNVMLSRATSIKATEDRNAACRAYRGEGI